MIRHFKFLLMVIGSLFFVACNGDSDSTDTSASSLLEGKTFYSLEIDSSFYYSYKFSDGFVTTTSYDLTNDSLDRVNDNAMEYTFSGNKMISSKVGGDDKTTHIVASTSNGVSLTDDTNTSYIYYLYNTIADAKSNPNK